MSLNSAADPSVTRPTPYQRPPRGTRYVFTLNNWTQTEYTLLTSTAVTALMKWMVVAKETGVNNTPHLQGAFILITQTAFSTVKRLGGFGRAHLEMMRGSPQDSLAYCSKQDSAPFVYGILPTPGKRNDLKEVASKIIGGAKITDLTTEVDDAVCVIKFHKGLTILRSLVRPPRSGPPKVFWIHGETGVGKTRCCFEWGNRMGDVWISSGGLRWFDGYDGQETVIFDDFRTKGVQFSFLLRILDRYPMSVEFKGGFVGWNPKYIFITAPEHPQVMFSQRKAHIPEDYRQLERRISHIFFLPNDQDDLDCTLEKLILPDPAEHPAPEEEMPEPDTEGNGYLTQEDYDHPGYDWDFEETF